MTSRRQLAPYRQSLAGTLLAAREAVMAPIRPILRDAGVTEQQWRVLRVLADEGSGDASRLAAAALLHAPSVTRILRELLERRLIERASDPADGRRSIVAISAAGSELVRATADHTLVKLDLYAQRFGRERMRLLVEELRLFTATIGEDEPLSTARWTDSE